MTNESRAKFKQYIAGIIAHWLDTKERQVRTKAWLSETIRRALWAIKDCPPEYRAETITEGLIKSCVTYLNETGQYLIMPNRSPKGYICVMGPKNMTPDILTTIENIKCQRKTVMSTIDNQILKPAQISIQIQLPAAYEAGMVQITNANAIKKQLTDSSDLQESINAIRGLGKTRLIEVKTLKAVNE